MQVAHDAELKKRVQALLPDMSVLQTTVENMLLTSEALTDSSKKNLVRVLRGLN